jgi:4-diphosphocytidyl-2-C-methyl-D-erythritol kinase
VRATGHLEFGLRKVIPMGAGLGGGSSDAAAALLALPVLAGRRADLPLLMRLAAEVGSDVPFFLLGGTALGLGRGAEIYPLPDLPPLRGLLAAPGVHVSTAEAYRALGPSLTTESLQNKMVSFQSQVWYGVGDPAGPVLTGAVNDFETVIFEQFPQLASVRKRLCRLGAAPARMSGSGSALFGLFGSPEQLARARTALADERLFPITLVSRARYRSLWWRSLRAHINENLWPPRSRYVR